MLFQRGIIDIFMKNERFAISHTILIVFYVLALFYFIYKIITYEKKGDKVVYIFMTSFLFLGLIDRSGCFTFYIYYFEYDINGNFLFLATELPSFCFVSYYSGISYFFIQYYKKNGEQLNEMSQLKKIIIILNAVMYLIFFVIVPLEFIYSPNETASVDQPQSLAQRVISLFIGLIELIFSVISSIYFVLLKFNDSYISTNQLFANTNDADFQVDHRLKYLGISLLGSGVFFSRGIVTIISIFIVIDHSGLKDLFYYFFSEIVPIFVTLYYMEEIQNLTGRSANEGRALLGENRT